MAKYTEAAERKYPKTLFFTHITLFLSYYVI